MLPIKWTSKFLYTVSCVGALGSAGEAIGELAYSK